MHKATTPFDKTDFEVVQRDILYQGVFRLVRLHLRHRLFNGGWSNVFTREIMERYTAAAVLPYDPKLDRIILIEQFRSGALHDPQGPWQIEIPAGIICPDEEPLGVAIREAREETGCKVSNLELIYDYFISPGASNEYIHIYYGLVDASHVNGIHGLPEENEDIRVRNVSADEAMNLLQDHKIRNAPAIIALQWFALNRERLRKISY
ncbi:MAG: NUDIX domain-containing protein [Gammaproteobacteria bacterium]